MKKPKGKAGAGHPVTTGSASVPRISFRAPSAAAYAELEAEAKRKRTTVNLIAKARTFPESS